MKLTKQDIGKTFWAEPTGNSRERGKSADNSIKECVIVDMRRKNGAFRFVNSQYHENFSVCDYERDDYVALDMGANFGYRLWSSKEDFLLKQKAAKATGYINEAFKFCNSVDIKSEKIIEAAKILGWEE